MKIYRKIIPRISKDVIRALLANRAIEIEDGHRDEAELDVAGIFVSYLNSVDELSEATHEALQRHSLPAHQFQQVRAHLAKKRQMVVGDGALEYLHGKVIDSLFNSKHVREIFAEDEELNKTIETAIGKYLGVDAELDREIRHRLKNLREGTAEWEVEYADLINRFRYSKKAN